MVPAPTEAPARQKDATRVWEATGPAAQAKQQSPGKAKYLSWPRTLLEGGGPKAWLGTGRGTWEAAGARGPRGTRTGRQQMLLSSHGGAEHEISILFSVIQTPDPQQGVPCSPGPAPPSKAQWDGKQGGNEALQISNCKCPSHPSAHHSNKGDHTVSCLGGAAC